MISKTPQIVVLTPIKNEAWILQRFLSVTSQFADSIIIADQQSTDQSLEICNRFPKVAVIRNPSKTYDEAGRQALLIEEARKRVQGPKILLALDADEIVAADATASGGWREMLTAAPGTILCFEKPDLFCGTRFCRRYNTPWPIGYVDDGAPHHGKVIHSVRVPMPETGRRLTVSGAVILHYALTRPAVIDAKRRLYSAIEAVNRENPFWRRWRYSDRVNPWRQELQSNVEPTKESWFAGWGFLGIDMDSITEQNVPPQDFATLELLVKHGTARLWLDDIWDKDWNQVLEIARASGLVDPSIKVDLKPSRFQSLTRIVLLKAYALLHKFKRGCLPQP